MQHLFQKIDGFRENNADLKEITGWLDKQNSAAFFDTYSCTLAELRQKHQEELSLKDKGIDKIAESSAACRHRFISLPSIKL